MITMDKRKVKYLAEFAESFATKNKRRITGTMDIYDKPTYKDELQVIHFRREYYKNGEIEVFKGTKYIINKDDISFETDVLKLKGEKFKVEQRVNILDFKYDLSIHEERFSTDSEDYSYQLDYEYQNKNRVFVYDDNSKKLVLIAKNDYDKEIKSKYRKIKDKDTGCTYVYDGKKLYSTITRYNSKHDGCRVITYDTHTVFENKLDGIEVIFNNECKLIGFTYKGDFEFRYHEGEIFASGVNMSLDSDICTNEVLSYDCYIYEAFPEEKQASKILIIKDSIVDILDIKDEEMLVISANISLHKNRRLKDEQEFTE